MAQLQWWVVGHVHHNNKPIHCLNHSGGDNSPEGAARCASHAFLNERHLCCHSDPSLDRERHNGLCCHFHIRPHGEDICRGRWHFGLIGNNQQTGDNQAKTKLNLSFRRVHIPNRHLTQMRVQVKRAHSLVHTRATLLALARSLLFQAALVEKIENKNCLWHFCAVLSTGAPYFQHVISFDGDCQFQRSKALSTSQLSCDHAPLV